MIDKIATSKKDFEALREELLKKKAEIHDDELGNTMNLTSEQYDVGKSTIYEFEKTNDSFIYLLPSAGKNKKMWAI